MQDPMQEERSTPSSVARAIDHSGTENLQRVMKAQSQRPGRPPTSVPLWGWMTLGAAVLLLIIYLWARMA